jgi:hypothetical protein
MESEGGEFSHLLDESDVAASDAVLRSIVVRSLRHRERRLKIVATTASVIAVAAASVAGVSEATSGTSAPRNSIATKRHSGFVTPPPKNTRWTKQHHALGRAPAGLKWSAGSGSNSGGSRPTVGPSICTVDGCYGSLPYASGPLQRLFVRTSGDITVRAFTESLIVAHPLPYVPTQSTTGNGSAVVPSSSTTVATTTTTTPSGASGEPTGGVITPIRSCEASQALLVEVSNPGAIGEVTVPLPGIVTSGSGQPFELINSTVVGVAESSPIEVLTVYLGPDASSVQASFSDGSSDTMLVTDGWAVLVNDGSAPLPVNLTAFDSSGASIGTAVVSSDDAVAEPESCLLAVEPDANRPASSNALR